LSAVREILTTMNKIELIQGNSYSKIRGLTTQQFRALRNILSYETDPQAAYFSGGWRRKKYLIDKTGFFPTGLLYLVKKLFPDSIVLHLQSQPKNDNSLFKLNLPFKPHEWQQVATECAYLAERGGIIAPTGAGKSVVIALIAARLGVRTLVVVPTLEIKKQLSESLLELLNGNPNVVVENIDSKRLKTAKGFDCLIIDETHHAAASTYQSLNKTAWNDIYYRFFLTATYYRNQDNEQLLFEGIAGQPIYQLTNKEAVNTGIIVPIEAYYIDLPKQPTEAFTWRQVYNELVVNNELRNNVIKRHLTLLSANEKYALCLVKEIKHGQILSELTGFPFANGQDEDSRQYIKQFNRGEIKVLIGTTGVLGEGIDTKPAEYVIIAGLGKAKSAFMQQIGRVVRRYKDKESGKVVLFRDSSHKFLLRHFNQHRTILKEELGIKLIKL